MLGFGFLLHLPWEVWLALVSRQPDPHLVTTGELPIALALEAMSRAGLGVIGFWIVAGVNDSREWIEAGGSDELRLYLVACVVLTLIMESLAPGRMTDWRHPGSLAILASPGQALLAVLQIVTVPLVLVLAVRRLDRRRGPRSGRYP